MRRCILFLSFPLPGEYQVKSCFETLTETTPCVTTQSITTAWTQSASSRTAQSSVAAGVNYTATITSLPTVDISSKSSGKEDVPSSTFSAVTTIASPRLDESSLFSNEGFRRDSPTLWVIFLSIYAFDLWI
jgi:hypothetical protein